jgi:hypothetical protein
MEERWILEASNTLGVPLSYKSYQEAEGPCPYCGGNDRCVVWRKGNWWCRQCKRQGTWARVTEEEVNRWDEERREKHMKAQAIIRRSRDWVDYSKATRPDLWKEHGIEPDEIDRWGLGYCSSIPLLPDHDSLTIPVFDGGVLTDIRHRVISPNGTGKYRSHMVGLPPAYFNTESLAVNGSDPVLVVEGCKKAIITARAHPKTVAITSCTNWRGLFERIIQNFPNQKYVIGLDPDATAVSETFARNLSMVGVDARVADFFDKPDDLLLTYGSDVIQLIMSQARRV